MTERYTPEWDDRSELDEAVKRAEKAELELHAQKNAYSAMYAVAINYENRAEKAELERDVWRHAARAALDALKAAQQ